MKTLSKKRGRPRSAFHEMMERGPLRLALPEGCAATRRNAGYELIGMDVLNRAGLLAEVVGSNPKLRKGAQTLLVELGRWKEGGHDVEVALAIVRDGITKLSETARLIRRMRLGERDPDPRDVKQMFEQTVVLIRRKFPGIKNEVLLEGLHWVGDILHEEKFFGGNHADTVHNAAPGAENDDASEVG